jgi:DNA-3-methyladenine glycosylase I
MEYHDTEWGVPVHDDNKIFEFLILEGAQAGLSWLTILKRRQGYQKAFAGFDPAQVARFTPEQIAELLQNKAIIRNKLKVASAVSNARVFLDIQTKFGSFDQYAWQFVDGRPKVNTYTSVD